VQAFREKPDLARAQEYVRQDNFFWNAGIFIWQADTIIQAIRTYQPEITAVMDKLSPLLYTAEEQAAVDELYAECPNISVDYAIMEKASDIYVYPSDFGWSDLGTWGSLHEKLGGDEQGNAVIGQEVKLIESRNCIVHTAHEQRVVIQGLDGYIVAERNNTLLICKLSEEQRIKEFSS
jgi:mannose-1-phosphate guanylyltransferase